MKKITAILATATLCFAMSMTSCSKKHNAAADDESTSTSETTEASASSTSTELQPASNMTPEQQIIAIINEGIAKIQTATTREQFSQITREINDKVEAWIKRNHELDKNPTPAMEAAAQAFHEACDLQQQAIRTGNVGLPEGPYNSVVEEADVMDMNDF